MKWLTKWFVKEVTPGEFKRIHTVRGELTPGVLTVDVETVDVDGNHIPYTMDNVKLKVTPKLRELINRVLLDEANSNDLAVLERAVLKTLK